MVRLVIVGVVVVLLLAMILAVSPTRGIGASTVTLSIPEGQQVTFTATLLAKGWFGTPAPVAGTISATAPPSIVNIQPVSATTSGTPPNVAFVVTGVVVGTGTITLNGTSSGGEHDILRIAVTVTPAG
jgi:hypothetical protein